MKKGLISLQDLGTKEILYLLGETFKLKKIKKGKRLSYLEGKSIGLLFQKPSNRTRVSFEVGIWQLGGNCIYLGPHEIDLGKRETPADVAHTLSRYLDGIVARTFLHSDVIELAANATIPIINGLSDLFHPCQALTDIFSVNEKFGDLKGLTLAYVGDGNNVCSSLLFGCVKTGINMNIATPKGYEPPDDVLTLALNYAEKSGAHIMLTHSPEEAVLGSNIIYADVWTSMGQEAEMKKRIKTFKAYQINGKLAKLADKDYIFMHCLPAHRGQEVTADIIDGPHSIVFDQAENRMHIQKSILKFLFEK